jgi:hypothetical protein
LSEKVKLNFETATETGVAAVIAAEAVIFVLLVWLAVRTLLPLFILAKALD